MILLPTRGRPEGLKRYLKAYKDTGAKLPVAIRLDNDDPMLPAYNDIPRESGQDWIVGPRVGALGAVNEIFSKYPNEPVYAGGSDDLLPRTENWDLILAEAAGPWGVAFGDDLQETGKFPTHPVIGGNLLRAVGWVSPPGFWHLFIDQIWGTIARTLGCLTFCPFVITEHLHFGNHKSPVDQTYRDHFARGSADRQAFNEWMASNELQVVVSRVKRAMANGN